MHFGKPSKPNEKKTPRADERREAPGTVHQFIHHALACFSTLIFLSSITTLIINMHLYAYYPFHVEFLHWISIFCSQDYPIFYIQTRKTACRAVELTVIPSLTFCLISLLFLWFAPAWVNMNLLCAKTNPAPFAFPWDMSVLV